MKIISIAFLFTDIFFWMQKDNIIKGYYDSIHYVISRNNKSDF